jgi:hypothetical protein
LSCQTFRYAFSSRLINWLGERLKRHSKTDSRIELRVVRLAADGVWLERIMNAKSKNLKGIEEYLIEMMNPLDCSSTRK